MRDASNIHNSGFKILPVTSILPRNTIRVGNSEQECRAKARRAQIGEFQRQRKSKQLPRPSLLGEQNAGLEHTRTEVIPSLPGGADLRPRAHADGSHTLPARGEQNSGLEQTRMEVIWTEYRQVDGTEHPARFRTYEVQICQISFCEDAPLSIARTE